MTLPTKTISQFLSDMTATWAAQTGVAATFNDGDVLLAWWNSVAVQLDFLQAQVILVVQLARAQTSTGADLDSWMAQFDFPRLGATFASGPVILSKNVASAVQVNVPTGSIVQSAGAAVSYQIVADLSQQAYVAALDAYVLAPGQTSITATVQAVVAGSASNVTNGTLTAFGSNVAGIDSVTNPASIENGNDAESDQDYRLRFVLYLTTLAKATRSALLAAAQSVQQGLAVNLLENQDPLGNPLLGSFTGVIDDGSGDPPLSTLNAVFAAFDATRAFSVQPFVTGPADLPASIVIAVRLTNPSTAATVNTQIQNAIVSLVNALPPGGILYVSNIMGAATAIAGVVSAQPTVTINGLQADLVPTVSQEIRTTQGAVTVTNY